MTREPFEAIVVGSVAIGESGRIIRLLSAKHGRVSVMARGARRARHPLVGLLDLGTQVRVQLAPTRGELALWKRGELIRALDTSRADFARLALAAYGCELVAALAPEAHEAPLLATLLRHWLGLLENDATTPGNASRWALEAKALTFAGLTPRLVRCGHCSRALHGALVFAMDSGGVLHAACGRGLSIERDHLVLLERLRRTPLADTLHATAPALHPFLLSDFARWQLGHRLNSRSMLEQCSEFSTNDPRPT